MIYEINRFDLLTFVRVDCKIFACANSCIDEGAFAIK